MFQMLDLVRLKKSNMELGVTTNMLGTVVDVSGHGKAYTVEFIDTDGNTVEEALDVLFTDDDLVPAKR